MTWIVILNWNALEMTADCIRSLLAMDNSECKIVVVDNGSTDGSVEFLSKEFPNIILLPLKKNMGFAAGCNLAMRHALEHHADYVLLLNNDTFVGKDFLGEMLRAIDTHYKIAAVCPKIFFADQPQTIWYAGADFSRWTGFATHSGWKKPDGGQFSVGREMTQATGCAMLVRCSALGHVGLLDERFWAYAEDLDWSLRFLDKGYRLVFAPKAQVWHRCGATSVKAMGAGSEAVRQFYSTRNMVFVARKHVRGWQIPTFLLCFIINHIGFYTLLRIWRCDFRALAAIYKGVYEGLRAKLDVSQSEEISANGVPHADGAIENAHH